MAVKKTMSKKDLFENDGILTFWERAQAFAAENLSRIVAAGLVVCVLAAGIGFWMFSRSRTEAQALERFYGAMNVMARNDGKPGDKSMQRAQALKQFESVHTEFSGTQAGTLALFYAASCRYDLKQYDEAIATYAGFLEKAGGDFDFLRLLAYENLGYAYEAKGDFRAALEWFGKQTDDEQGGLRASALFHSARCYEALGDRVKACRFYKDFLEKNPAAQQRTIAGIKVAALCDSPPAE